MVEIITRGRLKSDQKYEIKCRECETLFRFTRNEAEFVADQRDGDALVINCPLCRVKVWHAV